MVLSTPSLPTSARMLMLLWLLDLTEHSGGFAGHGGRAWVQTDQQVLSGAWFSPL